MLDPLPHYLLTSENIPYMTTTSAPVGLINSLDLSPFLDHVSTHSTKTPYGAPSAALVQAELAGQPVISLQRHGIHQQIPPHQINYRANIWALRAAGVQHIIGIATVGGIHPELDPGSLCIADQIIDYTYGREDTYETAEDDGPVQHIEFADPFSTRLRTALIHAAEGCGITCATQGVYGATQGPRLETAAEIRRMQRDGCDIVGMTGMPEASLAKEAGLDYANLSLVVNWAAGLETTPIDLSAIKQNQAAGMQTVLKLIMNLSAF